MTIRQRKPVQQTPDQRQGPRPLAIHLALQTLISMSSQAALPSLKNGSLPWREPQKKAAAALLEKLQKIDDQAFAKAVFSESERRIQAFSDGVKAYRAYPRTHIPKEPPTAWQRGQTRLLDYGTTSPKGKNGRPLLVIPSLINRAYVLDLTERRSLMRYLAKQGFRPFLVDWDEPDEAELKYTLTDYIVDRLEPALDYVTDQAGCKAGVLGYCMGGNLALALAQRKPNQVAALVPMATPWDFHKVPQGQITLLKAMAPQIKAYLDRAGYLPVDTLQMMFAGLDPYTTTNKFRKFAKIQNNERLARNFVALEDWLNDGVPLAGPTAEECLLDWYVNNSPINGTWKVAERPVLADEVPAPSLVIVPKQDYIVPPESALPLMNQLPKAERLDITAGHIGMTAGRRAPKILYQPLAEWLVKQI